MKKSFIRALKDLHKLESGPDADGIALEAAGTLPDENASRHVPPPDHSERRSDGFLNTELPNPTSFVGLSLPDETDRDGSTSQDTAQIANSPEATHHAVDTLTPWQADTFAANDPAGAGAAQRLAPPSIDVAISHISVAKPATHDSQALQDDGRQSSRLTKQPTFAPRIRPIPEKVDASCDVRSNPRAETEGRRDGTEDILDVAALLEASKDRVIIIPRPIAFSMCQEGETTERDPTATISEDTIEPLTGDAPPQQRLVDDILVASNCVSHPESAITNPHVETDDESVAASRSQHDLAVEAVKDPADELPELPNDDLSEHELPVDELPRESSPSVELPRLSSPFEPTIPKPRQPTSANEESAPSPTALPSATAFEEEVRDRLRQSTNLSQFQDLARRLTKGFSHGFAGTIAVVHLDEMQHALQVIASVSRVLGMNKEIKTLLVDANTNHKTLSKCFDVDRHEGFGEACDRIQLWSHLVRPTATPDVSILPAGNCGDPTGPGVDRVRRLLSALASDKYSVVLINAGEILNPLTKHVCKAADSAHLLVRLGRTERAYTAQAIHTSGIRFQGIIVTNVPQIG